MNSYTMLSLSLAISKISLNPRVRDLNIQMQLHIREDLKKNVMKVTSKGGKGQNLEFVTHKKNYCQNVIEVILSYLRQPCFQAKKMGVPLF